MLAKSQRLNLKKDFKWVSSGERKETASFKFSYRFSDNPEPLVGIALSSQYFKKAHERNRARRLTSRVIENFYPGLRKGLNLVIMPKPRVLEFSPEELYLEIENVKDLFKSD